ncbi:MAG TPA: hypothetical protein PLU22_13110 [Polyangiaceae bacterium]|nr:hypothetical protein [Polyangiaceae bacterium]
MEHVELAGRASTRRDLERRLAGAYYTPSVIAERLAADAVAAGRAPGTVGDPFCGDGRLVVAWLHAAARAGALDRLRRIWLRDRDPAAVRAARTAVTEALGALGCGGAVAVTAEAGDTFTEAAALRGRLDVVVTNPPWELLKPDARDGLTGAAASEHRGRLRAYAAGLGRAFPGAVSARGKAMMGAAVNLARAGALAAAAAARPGGVVALVLPAAIFSDQASAPFRTELFARLSVAELDAYPAEARLFAGVDQPFVTLTAVAGAPTRGLRLRRRSRELGILDARYLWVEGDPSAPLALGVAADHAALVAGWSARHPPLSALEADPARRLWLGRELDETRIAASFTDDPAGVPLLRGRHVLPFRIVRGAPERVDPRRRPLPATVRASRLAWRDVSRPTQRRRMHVALVPPGDVTGNSLGVACFGAGRPGDLELLVAILNGMVLELQVRARLATAHVSRGVLRSCAVASACFDDEGWRATLLARVAERLRDERVGPRLEVAVARAHGVTREELACVLDAFPKLDPADRAAHLAAELWA